MNKDLLAPRFKVIAEWPDMLEDISIGDIIYGPAKYVTENCKVRMEEYPHLFRPLSWWEDRQIGDMPDYVLYSKSENKEVYRVESWKFSQMDGWACDTTELKHVAPSEACLLPATLDDYTNYINSLKDKK